MKKLFYIVLLLVSTYVFSQNKGMTYQAVMYAPGGQNVPGVNVSNIPLSNRTICLQFSFIDASSRVEYQEEVKTKTDEFGMVNITIGSGNQTGGYASSYAAIVWNATAEKSLKVALDATGLCNQFDELSVDKLDAVPFANAAITAGNVSGVVALVNGGTGATTAAGARTNLGIGNVENTTDLNKPVSTATKNYIDTAITGATIVDADANTKGKIQLAGDLAGTAAAPTVPGLALKENAANKSTVVSLGTSNVLFPTQNAVKTYVDTAIAGATIVDADANTKGKIQLTGDLAGTASAPTVPGLALKLDASLAGVANGLATLNSAGIIPASQLPPISVASTSVVANQAAMLALSAATVGSVAVRTDVNKNFILSTAGPSVLANWVELLTPGAPVQSVNGMTGAIQVAKSDINLANVDNTSDIAKPISTATQNALNLKLNTNQVGVPNGTASLNALGKIPTDQIPAISFSSVKVLGSQAEMLAQANALIGSVVIRTDVNKNYVLAQSDPTILANWIELLTPAPPVQSVNGYVGSVALTKSDLGLANVDNTGDINKPVSTATQIALDFKANLASPTFSGTVGGITKAMVGLGNVDNTTDAAKPISTATQTALNLKANAADVTTSLTLKEDVANKSTTTTLGTSDLLYPSQKAVKTYVDTAIAGATIVDADATTKGKIQLAGDLAGTADLPEIAAGAISTTKLAANAVTTTKLSDSNVTTSKLADDAVTTIKITDASVTTAKLATNSVITSKISDANITNAKLDKANIPLSGFAAASVAVDLGSNKLINVSDPIAAQDAATKNYVDVAIAGATIVDADPTTKGKLKLAGDLAGTADLPAIAASAVTSSKILDGTIAMADIANDAVETTKIKDANVTYAKIQNVTTGKVLGRVSANAGVVEEIATTGSGDVVRATSPTLITPDLGTPSAAILTNATGLPLTSGITGVLAITNGGTNATTAAGALSSLGAEATANKSTAVDLGNSAPSDILFPSQKAVKAYVDSSVSSGAPDATISTAGKIKLAGDLTGTAALPEVVAGAISNTKLAANAVTTVKIADDAVETVKIKNANVTYVKIQNVADNKVLGNFSGSTGSVQELSTTGSGNVVRATSPTLVTPALGVAKATSVEFSGATSGTVTITAPAVAGTTSISLPAASGTLATLDGTETLTNKTLTSPVMTTPSLGVATATSINSTTIPTSKTLVVTTDKLNVMAATTSAELAGVISDESGTGSIVLSASPTFTGTPTLPTGTIGVTQTAGDNTTALATTAFVTTANATNANLTGEVTSTGNATTVTNAAVIGKVLTGFTAGAGIVAATDTILQAIQKIDGNDALKAPLASPTFTGTPLAPTAAASTNTTQVATTEFVTSAVTTANATNANLTGMVTSVGNATSLGSFTSANLATALSDETGSGVAVLATSPTLVTPVLGVATATSVNGTTIPSSKTLVVTTDKISTLAETTSAELAGKISDETGTGALVFATSPTLVTPALGIPSAAVLTNATGLPISTGVSGLGTGVATALATPSSANVLAAVTDETGTGALVFATSPTLVTPTLGVATATSVNGLTPTAQTTGFTIAGGTASKTLTVSGDASVSGTNTGDQTTVTGNAGTATKLATARKINTVDFDGSADITVTAAAGTLTGTTLNSTVTASSLTSVGTLANLTVTNAIAGSITGNAATVTTNANLTGDVTSTGNATTVGKINGTSLSGLATGILKNTTSTGVPSIAVAADFPTLNQNTTGTAANVTGTVAIANGGTGSSTQNFVDLTTAQTIAGVKTFSGSSTVIQQNLTVNSAGTTGQGIILSDDGDIVDNNDGAATFRFGAGIKINNGNKSAGTTTNITLTNTGNISATGNISGNQLTSNIATGTAPLVVTSTTPVANLNIGGNAATATKLATARKINTVDFDGSADITVTAAAGTLTGTSLASNIVSSSLTSVGTIATGTWNGTTIAIANGGTGQTTKAAAFDALSPMTTAGDIIYGGTSGTGTRLPKGTDGQVLTLASGVPAWSSNSNGGASLISATATMAATDTYNLIVFSGSTASQTITLPSASLAGAGREITIKNIASVSVSVAATEGSLISDSTTTSATTLSIGVEPSNNWIKAISTGANWIILRGLF